LFYFSGKTNRSYLFPIAIILFSTFVLTQICAIIVTIFVLCRKRLRKKQIINKSKNVHNIELEKVYDKTNNEYDRNCEEMIDNEIYNYDIGSYDEINYNELNVETNKTVENTKIFE